MGAGSRCAPSEPVAADDVEDDVKNGDDDRRDDAHDDHDHARNAGDDGLDGAYDGGDNGAHDESNVFSCAVVKVVSLRRDVCAGREQ
ncbi:hypothetical protein DAEQUDRAFT_732433 [Daedalea quercina L-15889]|uniref:Uncharacterized protein n=1 Tax=Daedalea quercina L-15889 TaxID=1314783 RepID=A0A165LLQ9_9APHY|nr:hypothetical protein DAEQUDRAFT_732433 [Daedalea quercina L-15889]